jgi:SAM-dependent methyltransferase
LKEQDLKLIYEDLVAKYGPWRAHNIRLSKSLTTRGDDWNDPRGWFYSQLIRDLFPGTLNGLKALDLGCFEGQFSIELGLHGLNCVGIEGRQSNISKAILARDVLRLNNVTFEKDDLRNVTPTKYGYFDVVINSGVLYHLDAPELFTFMKNVADCCNRIMIIDTHFSFEAQEKVSWNGRDFYGSRYTEFEEKPSQGQMEKASGSAIGNLTSFWLTPASLFNLLRDVGFSTIFEVVLPTIYSTDDNRFTLIAIKGSIVPFFLSAPSHEPPTLLNFELSESEFETSLEALRGELARTRRECASIYNSRSWKIAAALRRCFHWFKRCLGQ